MIHLKLVLCLAAAVVGAAAAAGRWTRLSRDCKPMPAELRREILGYKPVVDRIIKGATEGALKGAVWDELSTFVDKFGNRFSGTETLEDAIDYMLNKSVASGLDNVHGEPVQLQHWVRGQEEATMLEPRVAKIAILGLGGSVATPPEGITAEVMVVESFSELKKRSNGAKGKIVVFSEKWVNYGETVKYRQYAASEASKAGAVATLVRSVTPFSISSLHTGWQDYDNEVNKIPTASITVEDAQMLLRMYRRGDKIKIRMKMEAKFLDPVMSRNTVAEVRGKTYPEKSVVVSGHLDSWDVGTGAMDDGAGAFISWYSLVLFKKLNLVPRRTVRAILWTGEEIGLVGAIAYQQAHKDEEKNITLLMESDEGTFNPQGISFKGSPEATCIMYEIMKLMAPINATTLRPSTDVGSDIMVWSDSEIPLAALKNANEKYFWFHHSDGDRMTVEDSGTLDRCLALWAATAYVVADLAEDIPRSVL